MNYRNIVVEKKCFFYLVCEKKCVTLQYENDR